MYLWRCFQKGWNEKGSLRMGLCVNEKQKTSIRYPLLPDCGLSVTSHIIFLPPWRPPLGGAKINSSLSYFSQLVMATGSKQYTYTPGYICVEKFSGKWEPWAGKKFTKPWSRGDQRQVPGAVVMWSLSDLGCEPLSAHHVLPNLPLLLPSLIQMETLLIAYSSDSVSS